LPNKGKNHSKKLSNLLNKIFVPNVNKRISAEKILDDPWLRNPGDKKKSKLGKSFIEESKVEESKD
jgi:serine/threonine protein kinase